MNIFQKHVFTIMLIVATLFVTPAAFANELSKFDVKSFLAKDFTKFDALVTEESSQYNTESFCKENFIERMRNYAPQEADGAYKSKNPTQMQVFYLGMIKFCDTYDHLHDLALSSNSEEQIEPIKKRLDHLAPKLVFLYYEYMKVWHFYAWQNTPDPEERESLEILLSKYDDLHPREIEKKLSGIIYLGIHLSN